MADQILRGFSADGLIRIFAADTTETVREAQRIHKTTPVATAALGRLLTAAALMGSMQKGEDDTITLQVRGDGPIGGIVAVANSQAKVKGYAFNPQIFVPDRTVGKLNVGGAVGNGFLSVTRDLGLKEPYSAQIELVSGEIAEDITAYYATSEQTPTACALGVLVDTDGSVIKAGGYLLQLMPGADDAMAEQLEKTISAIPSVTQMLDRDKMSCEDMIFTVTDGFSMLISNQSILPEYQCDCNRDKVERALISMGREEMQSLIEEKGEAEVTCHFCDNIYKFDKAQLEKLLSDCKK